MELGVPRGTLPLRPAARSLLRQNHQSASEALHQGIRRCPGKWDDGVGGDVGAAGPSEPEQTPARSEKRLKRQQRPRLYPDGSNRQRVKRLMKLRASQELLEPSRLDGPVDNLEVTQGLDQEDRLPGLGLDQGESRW